MQIRQNGPLDKVVRFYLCVLVFQCNIILWFMQYRLMQSLAVASASLAQFVYK